MAPDDGDVVGQAQSEGRQREGHAGERRVEEGDHARVVCASKKVSKKRGHAQRELREGRAPGRPFGLEVRAMMAPSA